MLYSVVLISAVYQSESAICMHISPPSLDLPLTPHIPPILKTNKQVTSAALFSPKIIFMLKQPSLFLSDQSRYDGLETKSALLPQFSSEFLLPFLLPQFFFQLLLFSKFFWHSQCFSFFPSPSDALNSSLSPPLSPFNPWPQPTYLVLFFF